MGGNTLGGVEKGRVEIRDLFGLTETSPRSGAPAVSPARSACLELTKQEYTMDINFIAACLISNNDLNEAWKAEGVAARACNGGLDTLPGNEELVARSRARDEVMRVVHIALERLGLRLPSSNRVQAEVFTDFKARFGEDPFNGFCWGVAEAALKEREMFMLEQEAEWAAFCLEQEEAAIESVNRFKRVHA